jgi:TnpA family transposase
MWELDNIYRTIYILKYVDNLVLRQSVQKVLNRGEGYHQLRRAIAHENAGKLRVDTEEEQNVWNECARLVANAIIFFNSYILTRLLEQMEEQNKTDMVDRIKKVSPIAWGHINLGGRFKLTHQNETINIEQMLARLKESMVRFAS